MSQVGWSDEWKRVHPEAVWAITVRCEVCEAANPGTPAPALAVMWLEDGRWHTATPNREPTQVHPMAEPMPGQQRPYFTRTVFSGPSDACTDEGPAKDPMPLRCRRCKRIPGKKRRDVWAAAHRQAMLGLDFLYV